MGRWFLLGALTCLMAGPVAAQTVDDLSTAPLPEAVRNALAKPDVEAGAALAPPYTVLQEGPIDPALYRLGAGDELTVHYTGRTSVTNRLVVSPEGDVYLPDVGSVSVAGRTLSEGKDAIRAAARRILLNVRVDVSLTRLRTFKVSVGGEVRTPGVYAATAVTRVQELLREAGGLTDSAAVRDIRIQPPAGGAVVHVDLLPYLLQGTAEGSNPFVSDGQSLFVPRRSRLVRVQGAVIYPGTYDLPDSGATVNGLLALVGLEPNAAPDRVQLVSPRSTDTASTTPGNSEVSAPTAPLGTAAIGSTRLQHGNQILVPAIAGVARADLVTIEGEVRYPGTYSISGGARTASDVIGQAGGFTSEAVPSRVRLVRAVANPVGDVASQLGEFTTVQLTATEKEQLRMKGVGSYRAVILDLSGGTGGRSNEEGAQAQSGAGPVLVPGDRILVPRAGSYVEVAGRVKHPGFYAHEPGATAAAYVEKAGGYAARADRKNLRIAAGPGDNLLLARDAGPPEPGDRVWVPERTPRTLWENGKDILLVLGQVATIFIVINQAGN